nr:putative ribonuclease H-like domain-containing protein [Tanacetum cinerariifolium]
MTKVVKDQGGLSQMFNDDFHTCIFACFLSQKAPKRVHQALKDPSWIDAMQEELFQFKMQKVWILVDLPYPKRAIGTKWVFRNTKDERGILVRNKARLVAQGHTQEKGIDYEEVLAPVARIEAIRLFLAYSSFMSFMVYQMDVKYAFSYGTIEEEVYVCQPPGFKDPDHPDRVYKVDLCKSFEKLMKDKFQMSLMRELTFLLGIQVKQKKDGIFISQDKYVTEILRKFGLTDIKSSSTPIDTEKPLLNNPDGEDIDVHTYSDSPLLGVNTPRSDEDRLELIELMVFLLPKVKKVGIGVNVVDLQVSTVMHMLLMLVQKLLLFSLTNWCCSLSDVRSSSRKFNFSKYIFESLVRNVDSPTKFYMYPRFLQLMIRKQVGDLSTHTTKYTSLAMTQKVFTNIRRVGKGFSGVETPLFESMLVEQHVDEEGDADENVEEVNAGDAAKGDVSAAHGENQHHHNHLRRVEHLEFDKVAQALEITKLKRRVKTLETRNKVRVLKLRRLQRARTAKRVETSDKTVLDDVSDQGRMIAEMDQDVDVVLEDDKEVVNEAKELKSKSTNITTAEAQVPTVTLIAAPARVAATPSRRRKGVVIRDPEEESTTSIIIPAETKSKDKGKGILDEAIDHVKRKAKEDPAVKIYQVLKRKPQTEAQARKNMMVYLKNVAGFKLDYFKGMSYYDIRPIFEAKFNLNVAFLLKTKEQIKEDKNRALKRLNETPAKRADKRQKLDEEKLLYLLERYTCSDLEDSKKCTWSNKGQRMEAIVIMWCADHNFYIHPADFVSREEPLTRFTLDQILNAVRLEVKEKSEVSLELLRFTRQQHQEGQLE